MDKYKVWLRQTNLKVTKARLHMLHSLENSEQFLSAEELFNNLKPSIENLSLSTIYRSLEQMQKKGIVSEVAQENRKEVVYELAHDSHAHHLICLSCGKVEHIHECPVEYFENQVQKEYDFKVTNHVLDLYGYCKSCRTDPADD